MNHTCTNCGNVFPIVRQTRSKYAWGVGLRGIYTSNYSRAIDKFPVVVCPRCAHRELDSRLKFFGLLSPKQFKVSICLAAVFVLIMVAWTSF